MNEGVNYKWKGPVFAKRTWIAITYKGRVCIFHDSPFIIIKTTHE